MYRAIKSDFLRFYSIRFDSIWFDLNKFDLILPSSDGMDWQVCPAAWAAIKAVSAAQLNAYSSVWWVVPRWPATYSAVIAVPGDIGIAPGTAITAEFYPGHQGTTHHTDEYAANCAADTALIAAQAAGQTCQSIPSELGKIKSNLFKSNQIESNQIESNQIESNRIESNRIE